MIPLIGLLIGLILGLFLNIQIPAAYTSYVAVLILAALDSLVGGLLASLRKNFDIWLFVTGLLGNAVIAVALSALGDQLNIQLNLAAVFAFGVRIFNNFSAVRRLMLLRGRENSRLRRQLKQNARRTPVKDDVELNESDSKRQDDSTTAM
ncbi:small basic family protein [Oscillospiraceae bacterium HV4-5-C5C]|nr:small basic family protein [Oscillospiraceae bacterium HV4-5-C5C]